MSKQDRLTVGLIGALADVAAEHLDVIDKMDEYELAGVCDINATDLQALAAANGNVAIYTDYEEMLKNDNIDIFVVATPNHIHFPICKSALLKNRTVLCEKPAVISLAEIIELQTIQTSGSGLLITAYHFAYKPEVAWLSENLRSFEALVAFQFCSSEHFGDYGKPWNKIKRAGGVWLDWAPNAFSVLRETLAGGGQFNQYAIKNAEFNFQPKMEAELSAEVNLTVHGIQGNIKVDWQADQGVLQAYSLYKTLDNREIRLDHIENTAHIDGIESFASVDNRYLGVYKNLYQRYLNKISNIDHVVQEAAMIDRVLDIGFGH